jgi:hypothetical protein
MTKYKVKVEIRHSFIFDLDKVHPDIWTDYPEDSMRDFFEAETEELEFSGPTSAYENYNKTRIIHFEEVK